MDSMEVLADVMHGLVGEGDDLAWWQGAVRAAIIFVGTWAMLRLAGRRAFTQKTSFDLCIVLLLGAVLSRAVVGATSFAVAFAAALVLVLLHRVVGWLSCRFRAFDRTGVADDGGDGDIPAGLQCFAWVFRRHGHAARHLTGDPGGPCRLHGNPAFSRHPQRGRETGH